MATAVLVGAAASGKSSLLHAFARYLSGPSRSLGLQPQQRATGPTTAAAAAALSEYSLRLPGVRQPLIVADGAALSELIAADPRRRQAEADTVRRLLEADLILHVVDTAAAAADGGLQPPDELIYAVAAGRPYALLANKLDLAPGRRALAALLRRYGRATVIPCSAHLPLGLKALKRFCCHHL